jgi:hypothetical protein
MSLCQAQIQQGPRKGELCGNASDGKYCSKHIRQTIIDKANIENIRYCDISRNCYTVLEDYQSKCVHCLHKAKIQDRKREDKKRQDPNLCLDCGCKLTDNTRAKGKNDKLLRRCNPCYEKLKKYESQRAPRERNYKAEAFTNKYVIWNHYVKNAKKRNINFTLSKNIFNSLIIQKCFYCNYIKDSEVNGIDRIDNNKGYIEDNVVSCCQNCNTMKGSQHPLEFIDKLQMINIFKITNTYMEYSKMEKWKTTYLSKITPKYKSYAKSANSRNIEFKLSEEEFSNIIKQVCYLCGIPTSDINSNGIDRFNNNKGYILDNCRSCCGHCNILKKDLLYEVVIKNAKEVASKYDELTEFLRNKDINIRASKVESRIKVENPISQESESRIYKPLNEVIIPKSELSEEIKEIMKNNKNNAIIKLKQWKVKQIYEAIQENNENEYKLFCEQNNDISKIPDWNSIWPSFVLSIKGQSQQESESIIREFIENLRRIRHNTLCTENKNIVDREDRLIWPATSIVRAYLDGKIDNFKTFTEAQTGDDPNDVTWQKRWNKFIKSLEENKENENKLKSLCSKFLTAQRTKRYRNKK